MKGVRRSRAAQPHMHKTIAALVLFTISVTSAVSAPQGDVDTIRSLRLENNRAIESHSVRLMERAWTPTIRLIVSDGTVYSGAGPLAASYAGTEFKDPNFVAYDRRPISITISADGRRAAEYGAWKAHYKTPKKAGSGTYLASWRKFGGVWKIVYEAYVTLGSKR